MRIALSTKGTLFKISMRIALSRKGTLFKISRDYQHKGIGYLNTHVTTNTPSRHSDISSKALQPLQEFMTTSMVIIQCANDVKTLLEDLKAGKIITNISKSKHMKQLQNGLINLIQFVREQNKKGQSKYYLDCSKTHNKKTREGDADMMHSFFFLSKELGNNKHRMKRCKIRNKFKRSASNHAILDTVVQDIVAGRWTLPEHLLEQPILLIRSRWMKKVARRNKIKWLDEKKPRRFILPTTAVEL